jgi:acetyl esterase/lipase
VLEDLVDVRKPNEKSLVFILLLVGLVVGGSAGWAADAAPTAGPQQQSAVDEFGVSLSDTPPPTPPGFASQDEAMKAVLANRVKVFLPQAPIALPEGVVETKDVEYGKVGDRKLLLDLYMPAKLDKPAPGLIFIHGGGWKGGNRSDYKYYTVRYAKRGYVCATISYRFSQEAPFPAAVQDAKCAVRWMRANAAKYHVDPDRIAVLGGSAGGYLAMMVGYTSDVPELEGDGGYPEVSNKVRAVVNLYGPCDLDCPQARNVDVVRSFIGKPYDEARELYEKASPVRYVTRDDPPTLILHGTVDATVSIEQSDRLAAKLKEVGVPCQYEKFEGWPHTMDVAIDVNLRCQWFMNRFFRQYLSAK